MRALAGLGEGHLWEYVHTLVPLPEASELVSELVCELVFECLALTPSSSRPFTFQKHV